MVVVVRARVRVVTTGVSSAVESDIGLASAPKEMAVAGGVTVMMTEAAVGDTTVVVMVTVEVEVGTVTVVAATMGAAVVGMMTDEVVTATRIATVATAVAAAVTPLTKLANSVYIQQNQPRGMHLNPDPTFPHLPNHRD